MKAVTCRCVFAVDPHTASGLQEIVRADNIGVDEGGGSGNRAINVRLGREMHDRVNLLFPEKRLDCIPIHDIAFHESILLIARKRLQARQITGVRQSIQHNQSVLWVLARPVLHEIRTNESSATGNQ